MSRSASTARKTMKQLVQQQRDELYSSGHQNLNMMLPTAVIEELDTLKRRYRLRSRDAVVARVIRKCMATADPNGFTQRATDPRASFRRISPIVPSELAAYVKAVQLRFRNIAYGPAFEIIFAEVGHDLSNPALQLELIRGGEPRDLELIA